MYISLMYLGRVSMFIIYIVPSAINIPLTPVLCTSRIRKLKLGSHMNCPTLNGLSMVEPGFETEHAGPRAHPFNTVLNVFLSVGKSTKG